MVKIYYEFQDKNDFINYLGLIIEQLQKCIWRLKYYKKQVEKICLNTYQELEPGTSKISIEVLKNLITDKKYGEKRKRIRPIPYYKYAELNDRLSYVNLKILNIIGDQTKDAVSYKKFLEKVREYNKAREKNNEDIIQLDELSQDIREILNQANNSRNYSAHIGDSVFISQKLYRDQQLEGIKRVLNIDLGNKLNEIILVNKYEYVDVEWMFSLYITFTQNLGSYLTVFQQIRRDYSKLIGKKVDIQRGDNEVLSFDFSKISFDSFDMQFTKRKK